jgi:exonuclease III
MRESLAYIVEVIAMFDLVALQEVKSLEGDFDWVMRRLGPNWDYLATDASGNAERMVFVYNTTKVRFENIAAELMLDSEDLIEDLTHGDRVYLDGARAQGRETLAVPANVTLDGDELKEARVEAKAGGGATLTEPLALTLPHGTTLTLHTPSEIVLPKGAPVTLAQGGLDHDALLASLASPPEGTFLKLPSGSVSKRMFQFARTPYVVCFQAGWLRFTLCTVHIYYGDEADDSPEMKRRVAEIEKLTEELADRARKDLQHNPWTVWMALGDFNIAAKNHPTMEKLTSNGFEVPVGLDDLVGTNANRDKNYDQVAVYRAPKQQGISRFKLVASGILDVFTEVFRVFDRGGTSEDEATYSAIRNTFLTKRFRSLRQWATYEISDHLPLWVELETDFADDYLASIKPEEPAP